MASKLLSRWLWSSPPSYAGTGLSQTITSNTPETPLLDKPCTVKIIMGSCTFVSRKSGMQCGCALGSYITQTDGNATLEAWDDCGHPMHLHQDYANVSRPPELFSHPHISPRVGTVKKLAALLDERRVLHIRGTPSSGKTMLARLLWNSCLRYREPVVFVTGWSNISDPQEHLAEQCNAAGYKNVNCVNLLEKNITFILDEAQASYKDHALWFGIIKSQSGCHFGPKLRLFASYGSPTTGPAEYPHGTTPVHLGPAQRVSLTISCVSDSPNVCLFYNEEEFNDVLQRLCSRPWSTFAIAPDARDYLYSMTNGHPGAVDSLVSYMFEVYRSELKKGIPEITKQHLVNSLDDEAAVFQRLQHAPVFRSFPSSKHLTVPAANVFLQVLREGSIPCNLEDPGIKLCYKMGWVHSDLTDQPTLMDPEVVCFLPSRLHEKFVEYFLHLYQSKPFPLDKFLLLPVLCKAVLHHFSRKNLLLSVHGRHTPVTIIWPPEAQF